MPDAGIDRSEAPDPAAAVRGRDGADARRLDARLEPGEPRPAARGCAERAARPDRRRRVRQSEHLRRFHRDGELHAARGERAALQPLPRHGALLADQGSAADGPQPPPGRLRHGGRVLRPLPGLQRDDPARLRAVPAHPPGERLPDRSVREVAPDPGQPAGVLGAVRSLADPARVRLLLGLPRRRGRAVRPADRREPEDDRRPRGQGRRAVLLPGRSRRTRRSTGFTGSAPRSRRHRGSPTSRPAAATRRTTCRASGRTSTAARSTRDGT